MSAGFHPKQGLRAKIRRGEAVYGILCAGASPRIIEINARAGVDYLLFDGEHDDGADVGDMLQLIRAADAFGVPMMCRVPANRQEMIQRVLDYGAIGVVVPHIRDAAGAAAMVRAAKYPPVGDRAMSPYVRAASYGIGSTWEEYWPVANDEIVVMALVEDKEGMDNVEEIAAVPGLDILWIGAGDLSQSLGVPTNHPSVAAARDRGLQVAKQHGLASYASLGTSLAATPEARKAQAQAQHNQGYRFFAWNDAGLHTSGVEQLLSVRI